MHCHRRYDVMCKGSIQTLTAQVEAPSLETSKFSLYFSGSCIPINPKLSYIFPPEFLVVFNRFQCKKYKIFDEKFQILCLYRTHVGNPTYYLPSANHRPESLIQFDFSRAMPTHNPRTGILWERDCP
jgi:hypothetical protein